MRYFNCDKCNHENVRQSDMSADGLNICNTCSELRDIVTETSDWSEYAVNESEIIPITKDMLDLEHNGEANMTSVDIHDR